MVQRQFQYGDIFRYPQQLHPPQRALRQYESRQQRLIFFIHMMKITHFQYLVDIDLGHLLTRLAVYGDDAHPQHIVMRQQCTQRFTQRLFVDAALQTEAAAQHIGIGTVAPHLRQNP